MSSLSAAAALHFRMLGTELLSFLGDKAYCADTRVICADGAVRLNRFFAAFVLQVAVGGASSAMQDIAAMADFITEDFTIMLPDFGVMSVISNLKSCLAALCRSSVIQMTGTGTGTSSTLVTSKIHLCPVCDFSAKSRGNLNQHVNSCHENIRYKCSQCSFITTTAINLKRHVRTVHVSAQLRCDKCAYSASTSRRLKHHRQTRHEGVRFSCTHCTYSGTEATSLTRHVRLKHEGQGPRLPCQLCPKLFSSRQHLAVHVESVHQRVRHSCQQCQHVATTRGHLRAHVKKAHAASSDRPL